MYVVMMGLISPRLTHPFSSIVGEGTGRGRERGGEGDVERGGGSVRGDDGLDLAKVDQSVLAHLERDVRERASGRVYTSEAAGEEGGVWR